MSTENDIVPPSYLLSFIFSINLVLPLLLCIISPTSAVSNEPRMGASLLRLHFHDCFVNASHLSLSLSHMNALFLELTEIFKLYVWLLKFIYVFVGVCVCSHLFCITSYLDSLLLLCFWSCFPLLLA